MKRYILLFLFPCLYMLSACSDMDNYEAPSAVMEGGVYDAVTREPLPTQAPNGTRIRLFEEGSSQSINFWCKTDGSFYNQRVFATDYRIIAEGAFITTPSDTIYTHIPTSEAIAFYVEPFLRIHTKADLTGNKADLRFNIRKSEQCDGSLSQYIILYSWTQSIDANNYSFREIITVENEDEILGKDLSYIIEDIDLENPVFVRVAARVSGTDYYNYSLILSLR